MLKGTLTRAFIILSLSAALSGTQVCTDFLIARGLLLISLIRYTSRVSERCIRRQTHDQLSRGTGFRQVGEEVRGMACCLMHRSVIRKHSLRKVKVPIFLMTFIENSLQVRQDRAVRSFTCTIPLWMVGCYTGLVHSAELQQITKQHGLKVGTLVGVDLEGRTERQEPKPLKGQGRGFRLHVRQGNS